MLVTLQLISSSSKQKVLDEMVKYFTQFECGACIQDKFTVSVGGKQTNWELRIYPNGYEDDTSAYLALFVKHKEGSTAKYLLKSTISILDSSGVQRSTFSEISSCRTHQSTKVIQLLSSLKLKFGQISSVCRHVPTQHVRGPEPRG